MNARQDGGIAELPTLFAKRINHGCSVPVHVLRARQLVALEEGQEEVLLREQGAGEQ